MTHVIADVQFVPRTNDGPLTCSCGQEMAASQFADHRRGNGFKVSLLKGDGAPTIWNKQKCRSYMCSRSPRTMGWCEAHYRRLKRGADTSTPIGARGPVGRAQKYAEGVA